LGEETKENKRETHCERERDDGTLTTSPSRKWLITVREKTMEGGMKDEIDDTAVFT